MAHMEKYSRGVIGHMLGHYDRSKNVPDLKLPGNTVLNYNLAYNDQPQSQLDFIHQRLSEVKVHNRKDVNVMVDWVITIPQTLNNQGLNDEDKFFQEAYKFLNDRYGKENVISAFVHLDETTPHMHYAFVPVVEDKKKGGYKLSAKEKITKTDLATFHKDLSDHMERVFGRDIGILNEATKEGNRSIEELKRGTAREELNNIAQNARILTRKAQKLQKGIEVAQEQKNAIQSEIEALQAKYKNRQMQIREILELTPEYEKGFFGDIKGIKGVSIDDIENLKQMAIQGFQAKDRIEMLEYELERVKKLVPSVEERIKTDKERSLLLKITKAFNQLPDDVKKQLLQQTQSSGRKKAANWNWDLER